MLLTTKDLSIRWQKSTRSIAKIPPNELPRIDISTGHGRPTYRFRPEDVVTYENRRTVGDNHGELDERKNNCSIP